MRAGVVCKKTSEESGLSPLNPTPSISLDTQFLQQTTRRLALVSGVLAGAAATLVLTSFLLYGPLGWRPPHHLAHFLSAQSVLFFLSLGMALLCWRRVFTPEIIVTAGWTYQIAGALVISACVFSGDMLLQSVMVQLSWLGVWILLFPLLVPAPPRRSLIVALLCATTAPVVFVTWSLSSGSSLPAVPILLETFLPYYVCAGLAVIPAWLVYDLGTTASAAREAVRTLGSYKLVELLGSGGMGEVWRAEHSLLARPAAIKLVRLPTSGEHGTPALRSREEVLGRFNREAQAIANLTSPHTVSLFDYGVTEDGTLYYAMELLEGLDLEALVDRFGPVSPARAVYLLRQACESLVEAHRAGLVHRDIKPANLMTCHVGGRVDFIKVLDFGLVRQVQRKPQDPLISDPDFVVGTPAFMAPELATAPEEVDARADIYALGCVAYWLLTGRMVFEQPSAAGIVADHIHSEPLSPSAKAEQWIPPSLERLILDCLAKDPKARPGSAEEVLWRLSRTRIGKVWNQQRAHLWWQARLKDMSPEAPVSSSEWSSVELPLQLPLEAPRAEESAEEQVVEEGVDPVEEDLDPDFREWPKVPVGSISEIRIRARQRAYAEACRESCETHDSVPAPDTHLQ